MAVTRRSIWMDDVQWTTLGVMARGAGMSVSQLIRFALLDDDKAETEAREWNTRHHGRIGDETEPVATRGSELGSSDGRPMTQADRDKILKRVNKGN